MKVKKISAINLLVNGSLFIVLGLGFILFYERFWSLFRLLSALLIFITGASNIPDIVQKKALFIASVKLVLNWLICLLLLFYPNLFYTVIPYVIGWWALLNAIVYFFVYYAYRLDQLKGTIAMFLKSVLTLIFSIALLKSPLSRLRLLAVISGLYLIFYGLITLIEGLSDLLSDEKKQRIVRHLNFPIPIFLSALVPMRLYTASKKKIDRNLIHYYHHAIQTDYPLEVFIYIKKGGFESFGHVDIGYKGKIYSYGCHDPLKRRLMGALGDGVLIVADRDLYLNHALNHDTMIISYAINCPITQQSVIEKRIDELLQRSYTWQSDGYYNQNASDYASRVYLATKAKMYKFKEGKFRTYFVFSTNCVLLSDTLLKNDGLDLLNIDGINTPGRYLEFLEHEFSKVNTYVKGKTIYH